MHKQPRTQDGDFCVPDQPLCQAPREQQSVYSPAEHVDKETRSVMTVHNFIGVLIVTVIILVALAVWSTTADWPKRKWRALCCCRKTRRKQRKAGKLRSGAGSDEEKQTREDQAEGRKPSVGTGEKSASCIPVACQVSRTAGKVRFPST